MVGAQFGFISSMLQGPMYDCSLTMPSGQAWADKYGQRQLAFGIYSLTFGIITEILYIPCMIGLGRDLGSSCIKIMFCISLFDMFALLANSVGFGILLIQAINFGAVYCSDPVFTLIVGIAGYAMWITASATCILLSLNRLFEMISLSRYFTSTKTNVYIGICAVYGLLMTLFTRPASPLMFARDYCAFPLLTNSTHESMFFTAFIPGHDVDEYVNWPHAVHNIIVASFSCILYAMLCIVIGVKSKSMATGSNKSRLINNTPVFMQAMLICCVNLVAALVYVYVNFLPADPAVIVAGQVAWQLSHGSAPFIYLALNRSIRQIALKSIGLGKCAVSQKQIAEHSDDHPRHSSLQSRILAMCESLFCTNHFLTMIIP